MVRNNVSLTVGLVFVDGYEGFDQRAKEFPSVFQNCQGQRDFIGSLIEVTVRNDMMELDVKSCSQLSRVETVKVMFIIYC